MEQTNKSIRASSKGFWLRFSALVLAAIFPFLACVTAVLVCPAVYDETFLGGLAIKYERLCTTEEKKIVVVGGSSVAFGLDSELLSQHTGYEVVNFGLYATLGTRLMLDLSKANINEGDIVIVAPELDRQTLSMYFNAESTWQAIDSDMSMLWHIDGDNAIDMLGGLFGYAATKCRYAFSGEKLKVDGVYRADSFNHYGDVSPDRFLREYNVMEMGVNSKNTLALSVLNRTGCRILGYIPRAFRQDDGYDDEVYLWKDLTE